MTVERAHGGYTYGGQGTVGLARRAQASVSLIVQRRVDHMACMDVSQP